MSEQIVTSGEGMSSTSGTAIGWAMRTSLAETLVGRLSRRALDRLAVLFFVAIMAAVSLYTLVRPDYNWDMLAYVATALEDRHADPVALHGETWRQIEAGASTAQLDHLRSGNPYNRHQWENPVDFQSQLSMYRVKVAYVALLRAVEPLAGNLVKASIWLSEIPSFGIGLLCLYWLYREGALQGAFVLGPLLVIAHYADMTSAVSPDVLVALVSLLAIYALTRGRDAVACGLLFASVFIRPDNIILIFALLLTAIAFGWRVLPWLVTFAASMAACVWIARVGDHPGWWAHFYFSTVQIQNSMAGFHPDFALADFAKGYFRGVVMALVDSDWPWVFALCMAGWALLHRAGKSGGRGNALMFALAIGTLGKFASFPLPDDRFYFPFIAGMLIVVLTMWKPRFDAIGRTGVLA